MKKRYPAEVLTKHEIEALLAVCGSELWTDRRNYALLAHASTRAGLRSCWVVAAYRSAPVLDPLG